MASNTKVGKKYKDSVFRTLFNSNSKAIELYNTIYNTNYDIYSTNIDIITLDDVLYSARKNDLAFLIDEKLIILVEHQSTINENMPLRMFIYMARELERIVDNKAIYKRKAIKIPTPDFIVLYNGKDNLISKGKEVKEMTLKLSDAFEIAVNDKPMELNVKVIDIKYNTKHRIIRRNSTLKEYSQFINQIEVNRKKGKVIDEAVKTSIEYCIKNDILKEFLEKNSSEVINMLTLEYNEDIAREVEREEMLEEIREELEEKIKKIKKETTTQATEQGLRQGLAQGKEQSKIEIAKNSLKVGLTIDQIALITGLDKNIILSLKDKE